VSAQPCIVSYTDPEGFRHSVQVQAESVYEAVGLAVQAFQHNGCPPGSAALLEIEVRSPAVTHAVNMLKVREWAAASAKTPKEKLLKDRLNGLLAARG
jgi:hypothetical protein